jgi:hypothetical protein
MNVNKVSGQNLEKQYIEKLEKLKGNNGRTEDVVINVKMVERFYSAYDEIEVLPWKDILIQDNFEHVKAYFVAYNNLEMHKVDPGRLNQALVLKTEKVKEEQNGELERNKSLAIISD